MRDASVSLFARTCPQGAGRGGRGRCFMRMAAVKVTAFAVALGCVCLHGSQATARVVADVATQHGFGCATPADLMQAMRAGLIASPLPPDG